MNQNSSFVFIPSPSGDPENPCITPVPIDLEGNPIWDGFEQPTLGVLQASYQANKNNIVIVPDPIPDPPVITPDWDALNASLLNGVLAPIYQRINAACYVDPATATLAQTVNASNISIALAITMSALQIVRREDALAAAILQLAYSDFEFTEAEKTLWNTTVNELGFSEIVWQ